MNLKSFLDAKSREFDCEAFIARDPVQFPRRFHRREDIEIAAFLSATIAWGRRDLILRSAEKMFALMRGAPFEFVMNDDWRHLKRGNIHRTFFTDDLIYFCKGFRFVYENFGSVENCFAVALGARANSKIKPTIWDGIILFRQAMAFGNDGAFSKHIADPEKHSACKRIHLALRWLARESAVDLGLWKSVSPSLLCIPLDVHVARVARALGLLKRKTNDREAVEELTGRLREYCADDPVKYDFALFASDLPGDKSLSTEK